MKEFENVDTNGDGEADVEEVIARFDGEDEEMPQSGKAEFEEREREAAKEELERLRTAKDYIYHFDENGDMNITEEEVFSKMERICGDDKACYMAAMDAFRSVDKDKNGVLSAEEVIEAIDVPREKEW